VPVLVRVPWDQRVWVEQATLTLLQAASRRAGHNIQLSSSGASLAAGEGNGGWRSWDAQNALYVGWINRWPGYNVASNPDTGLRQHMRGAAVDIRYQSDRQHMLAVGFKPDAGEWWHFNHPNWLNMPIIRNLAAAGLGSTPINNEEDDLKADEREWLQEIRDNMPGVAGRHHDGPLWKGILELKSILIAINDNLTPGREGIKNEGEVWRKITDAAEKSREIRTIIDTLPTAREMAVELTETTILVGPDGAPAQLRQVLEMGAQHARVWDVPLARPDRPNKDGSPQLTRAGDMLAYGQLWTDQLDAAIVANGGARLTDAQVKSIAAILANQAPKVDEASIVAKVTTAVTAAVRGLFAKAGS
jgi:hypothetical protein